MQKLYEGKSKRVYSLENGQVFIEFKDEVTAFNGRKRANIPGKGEITARISDLIFEYLKSKGIPTHHIRFGDGGFYAKKVRILPVEVVVRNVATGSIVRRLGLEEGRELDPPMLEHFYKNDDLGDPMVCEGHILYLGLATNEELEKMEELSLKATRVLTDLFSKAGLILVDIKYEFGYDKEGNLLLADEISPDTCRIWDERGRSYDKDIFRKDLGDLLEAYREVYRRISSALQL